MRKWLRSDGWINVILLGYIVSCFIRDLITGTYAGLSLPAELLKSLFSKHFWPLRESPALPGWLTKWLERRLQTIHCTQPPTVYRNSSVNSKPYDFSTLLCYQFCGYLKSADQHASHEG